MPKLEPNKDDLFGAIAELIEELQNLGYSTAKIRNTLLNYGFTDKQMREWYGIGENANA